MPDAGVARQDKALPVRTHPITRQLPLLDFDPVRPQQPQSDRQTRHRIGLVVTHQGDQLGRLARSVDAAIGAEKNIDGAWLRASTKPPCRSNRKRLGRSRGS